ncbi:MAG: Zn-dependent hydrolase [Arenicellales bacterium WSBS_2016_MAG_OTU3]
MTTTQSLRINGERLWQSIMDMAKIGPGAHGGSRRLALTDEDKQGRDLFVSWCTDAGCEINIDQMGNIFARRHGKTGDAKTPSVATGSHLDTQPHGGRFDGIYGVLAGLEVVRTLNDNNIETHLPVEVIVWTNEEGSRFAPAMIASGVYAGLFDLDWALSRADEDGKTMGEELKRIGYNGQETCGQRTFHSLFEAHIEQGPVLEANNEIIGIVTGGQGQMWWDVTLRGQDAHAGSTPMANRKDALVGAAKIIQAAQEIALSHAPHGVATIGQLSVSPNSRNTIPGTVAFSAEVRNPNEQELAQTCDEFRNACADVAKECSLELQLDEIWDKPPVVFDEDCVEAVARSTATLGYTHRKMVSGAGHDACQVCLVAPTAMIFVPCADGISHNEAESVEPEHLAAGCNVLLHAMLARANQG